MNHPTSQEEKRSLSLAFRALRSNPHFCTIMDWIESERDKRDAENRIVGSENRTSEAEALSKILSVYAAADRDG